MSAYERVLAILRASDISNLKSCCWCSPSAMRACIYSVSVSVFMLAKVDKKCVRAPFCGDFTEYFKKNIVFLHLFQERMYFCQTLLTK